jgi:hypothetical protein
MGSANMRINRHVTTVVVFGGLLLAPHPSLAQTSLNPLTGVTSLSCTFPASVSTTWKDGEPEVVVKKVPVLTFTIDQIDVQEGSARMVGVASGQHVTASLSGSNLHIMDLRSSGSLTITTIFGQESKDGKLKAVHTRTDYLRYSVPGFVSQPEISQHYGDCEVKR